MAEPLTSELIKMLQNNLEKHGDLPVGVQVTIEHDDEDEDYTIWSSHEEDVTLFKRGNKLYFGEFDNDITEEDDNDCPDNSNTVRVSTNIDDLFQEEKPKKIPLILFLLFLIGGLAILYILFKMFIDIFIK